MRGGSGEIGPVHAGGWYRTPQAVALAGILSPPLLFPGLGGHAMCYCFS